jgi:signal transduction histidine kinase
LISDLLELIRADAGKLSFDREPVNVNALAREAARKHADAAIAKQAQIDVSGCAENPVILTDSSYVQQIVDVLVYNAVRYTPEQGSVHVAVDIRAGRRSSDPENWVCVAVTDTGAGVPEAEQVFEEVHRVEQGRGNIRFRLAICRRIARLLGGDLMLETVKDAGSTFTLWLPVPAPH